MRNQKKKRICLYQPGRYDSAESTEKKTTSNTNLLDFYLIIELMQLLEVTVEDLGLCFKRTNPNPYSFCTLNQDIHFSRLDILIYHRFLIILVRTEKRCYKLNHTKFGESSVYEMD